MMSDPVFYLIDGDKTRVGELHYYKLSAAKANAKRTAVKRAKAGKSHVSSMISVMQMKGADESIWAEEKKHASFYGYELIGRA